MTPRPPAKPGNPVADPGPTLPPMESWTRRAIAVLAIATCGACTVAALAFAVVAVRLALST